MPAFVVVAFLMTFRSLGKLDTHVVGNSGDPLLILWILGWVQHAIPHGWDAIWNTSMFFPEHNTLAYSDSMLSVAVIGWPLRVVFGEPLSLNILELAAQTASLWFMYLLTLRLTRSWPASVVAALAFTFATPLLAHLAHYQLSLTGFLVPLTTLLLVRYLETWKLRFGVGIGLTFGALTTSATYYGLMMACAVPVIVVGYVIWFRPKPFFMFVRGLAAGVVVAAAFTIPVAIQYMDLQDDPYFHREFDPSGGPFPGDFLSPAGEYLLDGIWPFEHIAFDRGIENRLFPGVIATGFGIAGAVVLVMAARRRSTDRADPSLGDGSGRAVIDGRWRSRVALLIAASGVVSVVIALGDEISIAGTTVPLPFQALREHVPGFSGIRANSRFVVMGVCALALCAAFAVEALLRRLGWRSAIAVFVVLCGFVIAETAVEVPLVKVPDGAAATAVGRFLVHRPPGVVAELPMRASSDGPAWPYLEAPRQFVSLIDANDRVNGYSGYAPKAYDDLAPVLNGFPDKQAMRALDEHDVRYVVLRTRVIGQQDPEMAELLDQDGYGRFNSTTAQARISLMPSERLRRVSKVPGAYIIELRCRQLDVRIAGACSDLVL